ncbi:AAA family ATPase [Candidatus Palauibacter sp.]|uniref:AAA family ATPase n=1 Tax=Candidatus Palauibacter sp. TaxID=3101350 RepID=UPI003C6F4ED7
MPPVLRKLRLDGVLSFAPDSKPFDLQTLNVLIGPNGSGKTNVIETLQLLSATPVNLRDAVRVGGGPDAWVWKGEPRAASALIEVVLDGGTPTGRAIRYRLEFAVSGSRLELVDEAIEELRPNPKEKAFVYYSFHGGRPVISPKRKPARGSRRPLVASKVKLDQSVLAQRKDPDQYPEITWVGETFGDFQFAREWTFGQHAPVRRPQQADLPTDRLLPDCSNLALVLNQIEHVGDTRVSALVKRFFPRFERLSTHISGGTVQFYLHETGFGKPIPATRLSDGTLRFVALLAALHVPTPPRLLCIEEPELGLHPDSVALLADVLAEASQRMQLIVTTHSDTLVSALSSQPDAVIACERPGAATVLHRLDPEKLTTWLDDYRLGDLWRMGELGANP